MDQNSAVSGGLKPLIFLECGFKWFGSLTNLSSRRPPEKTAVDAAALRQRDGSLGSGGGGAVAAGRERPADDMEAGRLPGPGYARSNQMHTHVGTVPRSRSQKKSCRLKKKKKKKKEEEEEKEEEGQSQRKAGEHVRDSPLLSALSSLSVTSLDQTLPRPGLSPGSSPGPGPGGGPGPSPALGPGPGPSPAQPLPSTPSPISSPLTSSSRGRRPGGPGGPAAVPFQRSVGAPGMTGGGPKAAPPQDVYVPMDPIAEAARRQTQEAPERESDPQEVERVDSHRDLSDSSGEYVKFSKEKFWLEPPSDKLRKQLEEELKLSGSNLKSHAWYHGRVPWEVSESLVVNHGDFLVRDSLSSQGDFVLTGRWEQEALHFIIQRSAAQPPEAHARVQYSLKEGEAFDSLPALVHFYAGNRAALTRWSGARIHRTVNRTLPLGHLEAAFCTAGSHREPEGRSGEVCPRSPSSLHREADVNREQDHRPPLTFGESSLSTLYNNPASPSLSGPHLDLDRDAPPADDPGSCYTELHPGPRSYVERLRAEDGPPGVVDPPRTEDGGVYSAPVAETASSFMPGRYRSRLMPGENKPLEVGVLRRVKELLAEVDPRTAAKHITKADCVVARILEVTPEAQRMMGVSSGMELLTLPHGQQLRLDLLERFHTMATTLAVDVLGCTGTTEERAGLLHKIIQIAAELRGTTGDMFGFAAVMRALELPQVSRLEQTWTALRQRHTEGAILYEKTLRPFMKSLNDGRESCPLSGTTFPHVLPLLALLEKSAAVGEGAEPWEAAEVGVDVVMFHLGAARTIAQLGGIYRSNAESKLQGFQEQPDVLELFLTDFQMRLLWGSRGAEESQALRYAKFDQVLTALSVRLEPPGRPRRPRPSS
ncbi:SH2 domain containing 3Cb [Clinocottus analis]|uniref:SH2 domain containing 3Cb n=1 Tax=Clinocottus analis TaxID=304258 RepID=UPI0035C0E458